MAWRITKWTVPNVLPRLLNGWWNKHWKYSKRYGINYQHF
jgi:hypothetical protein